MPVPEDLMKILVCPKCKSTVQEKKMFLICEKCEVAYPVLEGRIPDMLIESAWPVKKAEKHGFKHELKL